ncbi:MAG TPA: hypothetical protein VMW69_01455 [Spirochaetia bacterium]|nr:hypothetical protein [Spirochaetia bacterium]
MIGRTLETSITCDNRVIQALVVRIKSILLHNAVDLDIMGRRVRGYRTPDAPSIWIRDMSDMIRGFKYWENDVTSAVTHFADTQSARGWLFDYFTMTPEKVPCERENWLKQVRVPVEADVEYRFVKAVHEAWQACGDDAWLEAVAPNMERALAYIMNDELRWDDGSGLVKRAYTIDTWDFDYTAGAHPWLNFQMGPGTYWGLMHGDLSGYYEAFRLLAKMQRHLGHAGRGDYWEETADSFRKRANRIAFNGRFYTHHVPIVPVVIPGVNEAKQLSLSNPMAINRGLADAQMAQAIISEYRARAAATGAFAEWWGIDPPMPDGIFGDEKIVAGAYCNGGIMPLVGAELARAAFEQGHEEYGVQQLERYEKLTRDETSYLWYFPDGRPPTIDTSTSPDASPTDGWGSAAMLYAIVEGLAGVRDTDRLFRALQLSPRWPAAGVREAELRLTYPASGASLGYRYRAADDGTVTLELEGSAKIDLHLLLTRGRRATKLMLDGAPVEKREVMVGESRYVDASFDLQGSATLTVATVAS